MSRRFVTYDEEDAAAGKVPVDARGKLFDSMIMMKPYAVITEQKDGTCDFESDYCTIEFFDPTSILMIPGANIVFISSDIKVWSRMVSAYSTGDGIIELYFLGKSTRFVVVRYDVNNHTLKVKPEIPS